MALGRNLKRQQLIPEGEQAQSEQSKSKARSKKTPKKQAAKQPAAKRSSTKTRVKKKMEGKATATDTAAQVENSPVVSVPPVDPQKSAKPDEMVDVVKPEVLKEPTRPEEETLIAPEQQQTEMESPANQPTADVSETEPDPVPKLPTYEVARPTYLNRQEVTIVSQREYEKRLALKQKFDQEIRELKGKKLLLIVFKLGGQEFAIEIDKTKEVVKTPEIAPMPHLPEHMIGVANVRGKVVLIMDLGRKFHIADGASKWEDPYSIVIQNAGYKIGLLVPEVPNTVMVEGSNISTAAAIVTDTARDETYIKGIVKHEGRMIFFLDIEELVEGNKVNVVPGEVVA
ncbi:MAG: chemotaxis protein CheW [Bacteroidota bacterium]